MRLALLAALLCSCSTELALPAAAVISCDTPTDCPPELTCLVGRCLPPGTDVEPPKLVGPVRVSPARGTVGTPFTVAFEVSRPLKEPPTVTLNTAPSIALACKGEALTFSCSYVATGSELGKVNQGTGTVSLDVALVDTLSTRAVKANVAALSFDFDPPTLVALDVAYLPSDENPLRAVTAARSDTRIRITLSASEPLDAGFAATLIASSGDARLEFGAPTLLASDVIAFEARPGSAPSGDYSLRLKWRDALTNTGPREEDRPTRKILVRTDLPSLQIAQDKVCFLRSPVGNAAPELRGKHELPLGPYFALAPFDLSSGDAALPADTFLLGGGATPKLLRFWTAADRAFPLGATSLKESGWPRARLLNVDVPALWITGADEAGNESPAVQLRTSVLLATSRRARGAGSLVTLANAGPSQVPDPLVSSPASGTSGDGLDGAAVTATTAVQWREWRSSADQPAPRSRHGLAYDVARARLVLFGGLGVGFVHLNDVWEFDGVLWKELHPAVSPARREHANLTWDSVRSRAVLFGGSENGSTPLQDLWEWDGATWTEQTATPKPPGRIGHGLTFDAARGRVQVYGGHAGDYRPSADFWEWDGASWSEIRPAAGDPWPGPRMEHAIAYDEGRKVTVLFGGSDATSGFTNHLWEYDATTGKWTNRTPTSGPMPSVRKEMALAYDAGRKKVVLFGGSQLGPPNDVWEWDGTSWTDRTPAGPRPSKRSGVRMAYDPVLKRMMLSGGSDATAFGDLFAWTGSEWAEWKTGRPTLRHEPRWAYDTLRKRVVLYGGFYSAPNDDVWEWSGLGWSLIPVTSRPPARGAAAMAYDAARGETVLWGGSGPGITFDEVWTWNGTAWTRKATGVPFPAGRTLHAMAYDAKRQRVVLFGGRNGGQEVWEWSGAAWANVTPAAGASPAARVNHQMTWDPVAERVLVFGGDNDRGGAFDDLWEWDGKAWTERVPATGSARPAGRSFLGLTFDPLRGRTVLFGGGNSAGLTRQDSWEWAGARWLETTPAGLKPQARTGHLFTWDDVGRGALVYGGYATTVSGSGADANDQWLLDSSPQRQPAVQLTSVLPDDVALPSIQAIAVRAFCGARSAAGAGASLQGWSSQGRWMELAKNGDPTAGPFASPAAYSSAGAAEARRLIGARDRTLSLQCRPLGGSISGAESQVALDYLEASIRYEP